MSAQYLITNSNQLSKEMAIFSKSLIEKQYARSLAFIKERLVKIFKTELSPYLKENADEDEFFKLLNDLQNGALDKTANKMHALMTTGLNASQINAIKDTKDLTQFIHKLQEGINIMNKVLQPIVTAQFSSEITTKLQLDNIIANIQNKSVDSAIDDAKQQSRDYYLGSNFSFSVDARFKNSLKKQEKNIRTALANLKVLTTLAQELATNGTIKNVSEDLSKFTSNFLWSTFNCIGKILGIFSEDFFVEDVQQYVSEVIFQSSKNSSNVKITTSSSGTEKGSVFTTKTSDIQINLNIPKMIQGKEEGTISVTLPGVSLKRTRNARGQGKIKLKTGANFANFLQLAPMSDDEKKHKLRLFYSAFLAYRRSVNKHFLYNNKTQMDDMYSFFKIAMFPSAIAGSLDKDDFAYFLVINDKTYNIIEIMEKFVAADS